MTTETENTYPGLEGSDMAIVCDERVYSFYVLPDLRSLEAHKTYIMQVVELPDQPGTSGYKFYETTLDLSDASWMEVIRSAQENGSTVWAILVDSNTLTETGGDMVVGSRLHANNKRLRFVYDNTRGTMDVQPLDKE